MAAAAAGTAAFALYENWDTAGPMINDAVGRIGDYLMAFADTDWFAKGQEIGTMVSNWLGSINWAGIGAWITTFFGKIGSQFDKIDFKKFGGDIGAKISAWFAAVDWGAVGSTIWAVLKGVGSIMFAAISFIGGLAWSLLTAALGSAWEHIKAVGQAAWDGIKATGAAAINFLIDKINALIVKWNALAPSFAEIGAIERVGATSDQTAKGAAGRASPPKVAVAGEATVNLRLPDGSKVGTARVPMVAPTGPRRPGLLTA